MKDMTSIKAKAMEVISKTKSEHLAVIFCDMLIKELEQVDPSSVSVSYWKHIKEACEKFSSPPRTIPMKSTRKAKQTAIWLLMYLSDKMPNTSVADRIKEANVICGHTKQALQAAKEPVENIRFWDDVSLFYDEIF
jgi:hypothetical protein